MAAAEAIAAIERYGTYFSRPTDLVAVDLERYAALLRKWQPVQNLVSRETLGDLWQRHIADSLQVLKLLGDEDFRFMDLGSGGGLPAVPLAIAKKGDTTAAFSLVEPNARKASFLRSVARELGLPVVVRTARVQEIDSRETSPPDVITSRALAPLSELCSLSAPFFGPRTRAIFHKGGEYGEELAETRARWDFDVLILPSDTNRGSALLEIRNLRARPTV